MTCYDGPLFVGAGYGFAGLVHCKNIYSPERKKHIHFGVAGVSIAALEERSSDHDSKSENLCIRRGTSDHGDQSHIVGT